MSRLEISDEDIRWFAETNGCLEVHRSWRDNMLDQDRKVSSERMEWQTLHWSDKVLDAEIAYDVIRDFVAWYNGQEVSR